MKKIASVLIILAIGFMMAGGFPQKLRSFVKSSLPHTSATPAVVVQIPVGSRLSPEQAKFLEQHKRRHELLRNALQ